MHESTGHNHAYPEAKAYAEASRRTQDALEDRLIQDKWFLLTGGDTEYLSLIDRLSGRRWTVERRVQDGQIKFNESFFDDAGNYIGGEDYFFDESGLRRIRVDMSQRDDPEAWLESINFPPAEVFQTLPDAEKEKWFERSLSGYVDNVIENYKLEQKFNSEVVTPEEQQALLEQIDRAVPRR